MHLGTILTVSGTGSTFKAQLTRRCRTSFSSGSTRTLSRTPTLPSIEPGRQTLPSSPGSARSRSSGMSCTTRCKSSGAPTGSQGSSWRTTSADGLPGLEMGRSCLLMLVAAWECSVPTSGQSTRTCRAASSSRTCRKPLTYGSQSRALRPWLRTTTPSRLSKVETPHRPGFSIPAAQNIYFIGAKFYYYRNIFHDNPDEGVLRILAGLRPAFADHSLLLIDDKVLPDQGVHRHATMLDLAMMAQVGSLERTSQQWHDLLGNAGWEIISVVTYDDEYDSVLVAKPVST